MLLECQISSNKLLELMCVYYQPCHAGQAAQRKQHTKHMEHIA